MEDSTKLGPRYSIPLSGTVDALYQHRPEAPFYFGEEVAHVFDDMVSRSVPQYFDAQILAVLLARRIHRLRGSIVDIGCSTGTTLFMIERDLGHNAPELIGIDTSPAMLTRARAKQQELSTESQIQFVGADINEWEFPKCSLVCCNYTLQFIDPALRPSTLEKVFQALQPGGLLLLSEKTKPALGSHSIVRELHEEFKMWNGYSSDEVAKKRESLKGVLQASTACDNELMLRNAGFTAIERVLQGYEFMSWVAIR
jgi:tRNA (cmo5U34)-methyltransferase